VDQNTPWLNGQKAHRSVPGPQGARDPDFTPLTGCSRHRNATTELRSKRAAATGARKHSALVPRKNYHLLRASPEPSPRSVPCRFPEPVPACRCGHVLRSSVAVRSSFPFNLRSALQCFGRKTELQANPHGNRAEFVHLGTLHSGLATDRLYLH